MDFRDRFQEYYVEKSPIITKVFFTVLSVGIVFFYSFVMSLIYPDSEAPWVSIVPIIIFLIIIPLLIWKSSLFVSENKGKLVSSSDYMPNLGPENKEQIKILVNDMDDPVYKDCINYILETGRASTSSFQRGLGIGYNRASIIVDVMEKRDVIGPSRGSRPREIFLNPISNNYELSFQNTEIGIHDFFDGSYLSMDSILTNIDDAFLNQLDSLKDGYEFEKFIAKTLIDYGYSDAFVTQGSNDYGVDVIAEKHSIVYAIQCKYYSTTVGNSAVQEIVSGMTHYKAHIGVVATNNYFTRQAKELAESNRIVLWNRDILIGMIEKSSKEK